MTKALIVSNDLPARRDIERTLEFCSFTAHAASTSSEAWRELSLVRFDVVLVAMKLKDESGLAFYKSLRHAGLETPVLMMGEDALDELILKDLSVENYDFVLKPIKFKMLREKINVLLENKMVRESILAFGELRINNKEHVVTFRDKLLDLSKMELAILKLLVRKGGEVIHPKRISKLLEKESMSAFYCISKLRQKLKQYGSEALEISFVKDQGYRLIYQA